MNRIKPSGFAILGLLLAIGAIVGVLAVRYGVEPPQDRYVTITAHKYAYDPPVLKVNKGDRIHISLAANDVTHGFFLEGYDVDAQIPPGDFNFRLRHPSQSKEYAQAEEVVVVANRTGKFRYRCSNTCGYMHPFMQGELIVSPNYLFSSSIGMTFGLCIGMLWLCRRQGRGEKS